MIMMILSQSPSQWAAKPMDIQQLQIVARPLQQTSHKAATTRRIQKKNLKALVFPNRCLSTKL